jgi:triacylglycerol esterase/lipase EstA (alpha/beta hydrolase family)
MNRPAVEGFNTEMGNYVSNAMLFSDLALQYSLSEGGSDTITENLRENAAAVLNVKNNMVDTLSRDMAMADTNVVNTAYYLSRSKDLVNLASDVNKVAGDQITTASINQKLTRRQNEINEWSNFNKLEMLYIMQIIFISLSLIGILSYLLSISYINSSLFWTIVSAVFVLDLLIIIFKVRFTMVNRDGRYWNKMRFANQPVNKSNSSKSSESC